MEPSAEQRVDQLVSQVKQISAGEIAGPSLVYFDIVGIAWPIRCLLHLQGIEYNYLPISIGDWFFSGRRWQATIESSF